MPCSAILRGYKWPIIYKNVIVGFPEQAHPQFERTYRLLVSFVQVGFSTASRKRVSGSSWTRFLLTALITVSRSWEPNCFPSTWQYPEKKSGKKRGFPYLPSWHRDTFVPDKNSGSLNAIVIALICERQIIFWREKPGPQNSAGTKKAEEDRGAKRELCEWRDKRVLTSCQTKWLWGGFKIHVGAICACHPGLSGPQSEK